MKLLFLYFSITLLLFVEVSAQNSLTTSSKSLNKDLAITGKEFVKLKGNLNSLLEYTSNTNVETTPLYTLYYYKEIDGSRSSKEIKIIELSDKKKVNIKIIRQFNDAKPQVYSFDGTQFYELLLSRLEHIDNMYYIQYFPEELKSKNLKTSTLWFVEKKGEIVTSILNFDSPSISFKNNDTEFPPIVLNTLINLDFEKLVSLAEKDKRKGKKRN